MADPEAPHEACDYVRESWKTVTSNKTNPEAVPGTDARKQKITASIPNPIRKAVRRRNEDDDFAPVLLVEGLTDL
jgi:hypothetical protein